MNFIIKALITAGILSYSSLSFGQVDLPEMPTPPALETPLVTPETDTVVAETIGTARDTIEASPSETATPVVTETVTETVSEPVIEEPIEATEATPEISNESQTEVNIGLSSEVRQKVATILNKLLADEYVLYTKTLKFHWNVVGIVFHDFHQAFKEQYEKVFNFVDDIAERARALGAPALGSLEEFSTYTRLKEIKAEKLSPIEMVKQLLADHEAIIRTLRANIEETAALGDQGTSNFLQDLIVKHEKIAWMLRATAAQQ